MFDVYLLRAAGDYYTRHVADARLRTLCGRDVMLQSGHTLFHKPDTRYTLLTVVRCERCHQKAVKVSRG